MPPRRNPGRVAALAWIALAACTSRRDPSASDAGTTADDAASTGDPGASGETSEDMPTDLPPSDFLATRDQGSGSRECDLFTQDCRRGEKCMPWANDGGPAWDSTKCSPIADDPGGEGDPCTVVDSGVSGVDDCGLGLMCWDVDETGTGFCEDMCFGDFENPICDEPWEVCLLSSAPFALCVDACDPLAQDCPDASACYPYGAAWICSPDASGDSGAFGEPCEFASACDEGHVCLGAEAFSECPGATGCCAALCNVDEAAADAMCAALDPAQACIPWYQPGFAPFGHDDIGVCALPA